MNDVVEKPVIVASAQGVTDGLQAALRYAVVIFGFFSGLGALIGQKDTAGAVTYVQTHLGDAVAAVFGLISLGTLAYGIYKTYKRGAQLATVAADTRVPDQVAQLK